MNDPYETLGIRRGASPEEIREAYRRLVRRWHPDRFAGASVEVRDDAARRTAEITGAHQLLTDPLALARYEAHRQRQATADDPSTTQAQGRSTPFDYREAARAEFDGVRAAPAPRSRTSEAAAPPPWTARPSPGPAPRQQPTPPQPPRRAAATGRFRLFARAVVIVVVVPLVTLGILVALDGDDERPGSVGAAAPVGGFQNPSVLRVGHCFDQRASAPDGDEPGTVRSVRVMPCSLRHQFVVLETFDLEGAFRAPYPGRPAIAAIAQPVCRAAQEAAAATDAFVASSRLHWIHPSPGSWQQGDRRVVCAREGETG